MTYIKRITLQGFKSFNNKYEFVTPNSFVCITGPNGSGKSNLFDALSFVLGELSSKGLRTSNLANLIYNGGNTGKPAPRAKVGIVFDNKNRKISIENNEVQITREVNKKGHGTYRINGQMATRQRILSLLDEVGIDSQGYAIIKQGSIARLVDVSEEERLKIIEDIAGISSYEDKKAKAQRELEHVEKKLGEARIVLKEKEDRLKEIEREKRQAEKYNEMVKRAKILRASMLSREISALNDDITIFKESIKKLEERKSEASNSLEEINKTIRKLEEDHEKVDEEIRKKGGKDKATLNQELEEMKEKRGELRVNYFSGQREIKKIESQLADLNKKRSVINQDLTVANRENKKLEQKLKGKKSELDQLEKSNSESMKKQDKLFELQLKFNSISNDIIKKKNESSKVSKASDLENKKKQLQNKKKEITDSLNGLKQALEEVLDEESKISGMISDSRNNLEVLNKKITQLESRKQLFKNTTSFSVRKIMEARHTIPGIHGTVEELCNIPSEFSQPLRIALGKGKDYVVVENEDVASKCIEFLKENKLGVATFMPLNKVSGRQITRYINEPGHVGYALDMVKYDQRYSHIFSNVLFDTIIIENFEAGKRIGFGRNRMITLDGTEINRSGTVTGGYRKNFDAVGAETKLSELKTEQVGVLEENNELSYKKENLTNEIIGLREKKSSLETQLETISSELEIVSHDLSRLGNPGELIREIEKLEKQKDNVAEMLEELKSVEDTVTKTAYEETLEEYNALRIELSTNQSKANSVLSRELENLRETESDYSEEKKNLAESVRNFNKQLGELQKEIDAKQKIFDNLDSTIDALYTRKKRVQSKIEREKNRVQNSTERVRKVEEQITKKEVLLADKIGGYESMVERFNEFGGVEVIRITNYEERDKELKELDKEIPRFGPINQRALEMYESVKKEFDGINEKYEQLKSEKDDVFLLIDEIEGRKASAFMKTYNEVAENFERIFQQLTSGKGHLELTNEEKPLEGGVDVRVRTKEGKSYTHLRSLSGGEKTITALAFILAIQECSPSPFYIFDEIDAALDKENSEKLGEMMKKYSKQSQIIQVSHNDAVITRADYLYGVSMNKLGESSVVGIKLPK